MGLDKDMLRARVEHDFTYHPPKGNQPERYAHITEEFRKLALLIVELTPISRQQSMALSELGMARMLANASIACNE